MDTAEFRLTADEVTRVFRDCLFRDDEPTEPRIEVEGILNRFGFHPVRLESHRDEVAAMLAELPTEFQRSGGGGWSFLNACMDRHGNQWTGLHRTMDCLFCLGMGLGLAQCQLPRDYWAVLPGGMPYYVVGPRHDDDNDKEAA
jgi:hypothetical protein